MGLHPDEGALDHVVLRSRGGKDVWKNLVWSAKEVNQRKTDRLAHEAGLKLLSVPRGPKELPVPALIRNIAAVEDWKLFLNGRSRRLPQPHGAGIKARSPELHRI